MRWEKIADTDGIAVFKKEFQDSPMLAFKGEGVIEAPLLRVASVLVDVSRATEWMENLEEARILREVSLTEYIVYNHIGTPIVLKDRDFVTLNKLEFDAEKKQFAIRVHSVEDASAPKTPYVRGELIGSSFVLTSIDGGSRTHVTAEIHADPKGSVPKWIVNLFQKGWPYHTINRLRAQSSKNDIQDHPLLKEEFLKRGI